MLPRKGVLSNVIGLLVLILLINGLANGQTVKVTTTRNLSNQSTYSTRLQWY